MDKLKRSVGVERAQPGVQDLRDDIDGDRIFFAPTAMQHFVLVHFDVGIKPEILLRRRFDKQFCWDLYELIVLE